MGNYESKDVKKRKKYAARKHTDEQTNEHVVHECTRAHTHTYTHMHTHKSIFTAKGKKDKNSKARRLNFPDEISRSLDNLHSRVV